MKTYLVGGAVRDKLLGIPVKERDWVVVGATAEELLKKKFRPVGKNFPVFLHPETREEYALARTERKVGRGYTGFDFNASPQVTLEEDLARRDLTINAMAETVAGELVDPYHGKEDLEKRILRHVSPAFIEDPVRILRVARFAARYGELGFVVARETNELMKKMVLLGEIDALVPERVWKELERALSEKSAEKFFEVLANCEALPVLFPELVLESAGMRVLENISKKTTDTIVRFAALLHDLSNHQIIQICDRYRVPNTYRELALLVSHHLADCSHLSSFSASEWLQFLKSADAFRREERFKKMLLVCEIGLQQSFSEQVLQCLEEAKKVDVKQLLTEGLAGAGLVEAIDCARIKRIKKYCS